jgi:hypothetical protein
MNPGRNILNGSKTLFLTIFFLYVGFAAKCQFIFVPKKAVRSGRDWIGKNQKTAIKDSVPFSGILVVDSRYDTMHIGIRFDEYLILGGYSAAAGWKDLMNIYYRPLCLPGHDTLIIQLEKLDLQDDVLPGAGCVGETGKIKARLYAGHNDSLRYIGTIDTLILATNYYKNNNHWDHYLLQLFDLTITAAGAVRDTSDRNFRYTTTIEEISQLGLVKRDKPILKADSLHFGFYRDFSEFVNNHPTFGNEHREAINNLLVVMHYRIGKNLSTEEPDTSYWGYCDGKNIYVRFAFDFYQLEKKDADFYLSPTLDANRVEGNHAVLNLFIGIAALSGSIASKSGPEFGGFSAIKSKGVPKILIKSGDYYVIGTHLDWETGNIGF